MDSQVKVSVIIPCFNQGQFVDEAVDSVLSQQYADLEVLIVDDGSTDTITQKILSDYHRDKVRVLHTDNQGLASARNNGIREAIGEYILPLDADDRIESGYIAKAIQKLDEDGGLGIVYCRANLFGTVQTEWKLPPYSLERMLLDNIIFCSAMFRRADWEAVGGYDPGMIYGWEDYEFWLSLIEMDRGVYQIPERLFSYRVASDSMVRSKEKWQKIAMFKRIFSRHTELFTTNIEVWINNLLDLHDHYYTSKLYVDSGSGVSDVECVSRKVEPTTSSITFSLEGFSRIQAVRFDPVDAPAVVEILNVTMTTDDGKEQSLEILSDNALFSKKGNRYFAGDDPQIHFQLNDKQLSGLKTITVCLHFKALASDALQQIVLMQQKEICRLSCCAPSPNTASTLHKIGKALKKRLPQR